MGYNARDLAALFNEILLINIIQNKPIIDMDTTRLAFHHLHICILYFFHTLHLIFYLFLKMF
jgi:hypothetical protein